MAAQLDPAFLKTLRTLLPADSLLTAPEAPILQPAIASQLKARKLGHRNFWTMRLPHPDRPGGRSP